MATLCILPLVEFGLAIVLKVTETDRTTIEAFDGRRSGRHSSGSGEAAQADP